MLRRSLIGRVATARISRAVWQGKARRRFDKSGGERASAEILEKVRSRYLRVRGCDTKCGLAARRSRRSGDVLKRIRRLGDRQAEWGELVGSSRGEDTGKHHRSVRAFHAVEESAGGGLQELEFHRPGVRTRRQACQPVRRSGKEIAEIVRGVVEVPQGEIL